MYNSRNLFIFADMIKTELKDLSIEDMARLLEIIYDADLQNEWCNPHTSEKFVENESIGVRQNLLIIFDTNKQKELFELYEYNLMIKHRKDYLGDLLNKNI